MSVNEHNHPNDVRCDHTCPSFKIPDHAPESFVPTFNINLNVNLHNIPDQSLGTFLSQMFAQVFQQLMILQKTGDQTMSLVTDTQAKLDALGVKLVGTLNDASAALDAMKAKLDLLAGQQTIDPAEVSALAADVDALSTSLSNQADAVEATITKDNPPAAPSA